MDAQFSGKYPQLDLKHGTTPTGQLIWKPCGRYVSEIV